MTFFEVDHPDTQADKRARLSAIRRVGRPVLVAADFRHDDAAVVLAAAGHDQVRPSLFLCEGLLVYLDEQATVGLLGGARAVAGSGSVLAASLSVHADGLDSALVLARANARRRTASAEPWLTILPAERPGRRCWPGRVGWSTARPTRPISAPGVEPGRSLLVTAKPSSVSVCPVDQPQWPARPKPTGQRLLGPADIRQLAARLDVQPGKRLGQNFVIDAGTIRRIVALAELRAGRCRA